MAQAKLTLALMQGGAPNHEVLQAKDVSQLLAIAERHQISLPSEFAEHSTQSAPAAVVTGAPSLLPSLGSPPPLSQRVYTHRESNYQGARNERGEKEGYGTYTFEDGTRYKGQWLAGQQNGNGTMKMASGAVYVGEWREAQKHGAGTYYWPDGRIEVGHYDRDKSVGTGVMWSADGYQAWRIVDDGLEVAEISMAEANAISLGIVSELPVKGAAWRDLMEMVTTHRDAA